MTIKEQEKKAKEFAEYWKDKGYEKGESQKFWLSLLRGIFGIEEPEKFIFFEDKVHLDHTSFIDGFIPTTHVLIEQKGLGHNLRQPILQSDGTKLTPFQQAKRYAFELPYSQRPRWIVTCNFSSFLVYDMENPNGEPFEILLENLEKEFYRLEFLVKDGNEHLKREMEISIKAGDIVGQIYDEILPLYKDPENEDSLKSLNMLCVRLVFCLYAEDAGLFGKHSMFHDYLNKFNAEDLRVALIDLFRVLDTKLENRDPYLKDDLKQFPYVNGGLFEDENIEIPMLNESVKQKILAKASENFNWSDISPTIFGAVFESTLNPDTRRSGGMHYTSIENIHKVIDPLFMDNLRKELELIKEIGVWKNKKEKLENFQKKLASIKFLDPACGSGNFLTETYLSLRKIENEVISMLNTSKYEGQILFGDEKHNPIEVSISQFYGIEINDFAATVAKTALWIAESQMMKETESILHMNLDFLPLKSYTNITEGNALSIDWNEVISKESLNYIMGNPPFVGTKLMTDEQRKDREEIFESDKYGKLDYVSCWYKKAADYIKNTSIKVALVSTNSITQGEQPPLLWDLLFKQGIIINFAYRTFRWDSEASLKAHVHCVIIGFSYINNDDKYLYHDNTKTKVNNINAYLVDAPNIFIEKTTKSLFGAKEMVKGSQLIDGGNYVFTKNEYEEFLKKYPESEPYFYQYINADSFLNNREEKYCLCLKNCPLELMKNCKGIYERVQAVYEYRNSSDAISTNKLKDRPAEFFITNIPKGKSLLIPIVSSERRKYIPIGFIQDGVIYSNATNYVDNASMCDFGIFISNVHMAWMRAFAGRLKSDYRYSKDIIYNTFPIPKLTEQQKNKIENTAQAIIDARNLYPNSSLSDLYDEVLMPVELRRAHQANDRAVMEAYNFPVTSNFTESMCVAELMKMYKEQIDK